MARDEVRIQILVDADVARAIVVARQLSREAGLSTPRSTMIATAVSELARNILKYARRGSVTVRAIDRDGRRRVEILATDRGPGIADIETAMKEHFSSGGTLGLGLSGVERMMDEFDIESAPGEGTRVCAALWL